MAGKTAYEQSVLVKTKEETRAGHTMSFLWVYFLRKENNKCDLYAKSINLSELQITFHNPKKR